MKERPILFSGEMVRAILNNLKRNTRRIVMPRSKPNLAPLSMEPWYSDDEQLFHYDKQFELIDGRVHYRKDGQPVWIGKHPDYPTGEKFFTCPYGKVGDHLWVRETFVVAGTGACFYRADGEIEERYWAWQPSIYMPREYSRISLEITNVRVERLQDISDADAQAEGVDRGTEPIVSARYAFGQLWNSINAKRGYDWDSNPWVWVVEFRRVEQ